MARALVVLLAAVGLFVSAGTAAASPSSFAVVFGDGQPTAGGGGLWRLYTSKTATFKLMGSRSWVRVEASGGSFENTLDFEFAAPPGKKLHRGYYVHAQRAAFRDPGHPGIDIYGGGSACNRVSGSFEVKDIAFSRAGKPTRLWLLYEHHCEEVRPAIFGEIRLGEPRAPDPLLAAPGTVRWPANDSGRRSTAVPVTFFALGGPIRVTRAAIVGQNAAAFAIRGDGCTGQTLGVGASCQIVVRHEPQAPGTHVAALRVVDSSGRQRDVPLQGFAFGGRSAVTLTSDPGDYIGHGRPWSFSFANAEISGGGTPTVIGFGAANAEEAFSGEFAPAPGGAIAPGTYLDARRYSFNDGHPGIDVGSRGSGCNYIEGQFTVNSVAWWPDATLRSASVTFEQHCEGGTPALRGTFEFRAGDDTPLAPWMVDTQSAPSSGCTVPRMVGKALSVARRAAKRTGCRLGRVRYSRSRRVPRGVVISQRPRPGKRLAAGSRVEVVVSRGHRRSAA